MTFNIKLKSSNLESNPQRKDSLFYALINMTKEAVVAFNNKGRIVLFNPAAEMMFGRKADDVISYKMDVLIAKEYLKQNRKFEKQPNILC